MRCRSCPASHNAAGEELRTLVDDLQKSMLRPRCETLRAPLLVTYEYKKYVRTRWHNLCCAYVQYCTVDKTGDDVPLVLLGQKGKKEGKNKREKRESGREEGDDVRRRSALGIRERHAQARCTFLYGSLL